MKRWIPFLVLLSGVGLLAPPSAFSQDFICFSYPDTDSCITDARCFWCPTIIGCQPKTFPCRNCEDLTYAECYNYSGCSQCDYNLTCLPFGEPCGPLDTDGDGIEDTSDNCPEISNPYQEDTDGDGFGDVCDDCPLDPYNDGDGDGICESYDNCPAIANPNQADNDGDGQGDVCDNDDDNDSISDNSDNCPLNYNLDQADIDEDGTGDACDIDDNDNDGVLDADDQCPSTSGDNIVNNDGCSIADLCPCEYEWRNHGAYVTCVAHASRDFVLEGLMTEVERNYVVSNAAESDCGHKRR